MRYPNGNITDYNYEKPLNQKFTNPNITEKTRNRDRPIFSTVNNKSRFEPRNRTISPNVNKRLDFNNEWTRGRPGYPVNNFLGGCSGGAEESPVLGKYEKIRNDRITAERDNNVSFYTDSSRAGCSSEYTDGEYTDEDYEEYSDDYDDYSEYEESQRPSIVRPQNEIERANRSSTPMSAFSRKVNRNNYNVSQNDKQRNFNFEPNFDFWNKRKAQENRYKDWQYRGEEDKGNGYLDVTPSRAVPRDIRAEYGRRTTVGRMEENERNPRYQILNNRKNKRENEIENNLNKRNNIIFNTYDEHNYPRQNLTIPNRQERETVDKIKGTFIYEMDPSKSPRMRGASETTCYFKIISEGNSTSFSDPNFSDYLNSCKSEYIKARHLETLANAAVIGEPVYLPNSYSRVKTLLLDMDETLIHSEEYKPGEKYDYVIQIPNCSIKDKIGVFVRPNCLKFLKQLKSNFELVIFTAARQDYADEVLNVLDPNNELFTARLYRQNCCVIAGTYVKDFRVIKNRDPRDVILVDNLIYSFAANLGNGIPIKPYLKGDDDYELDFLAEKLSGLKSFMDVEVYLETHFGFREFYQKL